MSRSTQGFSRRWTFPKAIGLAKLLRVADPRSEARLCEAQHCPQFSRRPRSTRALSAGRQISAVGTKPTGFAHGTAAGHRRHRPAHRSSCIAELCNFSIFANLNDCTRRWLTLESAKLPSLLPRLLRQRTIEPPWQKRVPIGKIENTANGVRLQADPF